MTTMSAFLLEAVRCAFELPIPPTCRRRAALHSSEREQRAAGAPPHHIGAEAASSYHYCSNVQIASHHSSS